MIKKFFHFFGQAFVLSLLTMPIAAYAQQTTVQGGTGTSSPSGILYGDGTLHLKTVGIGSGCAFVTGLLSCSGTPGGLNVQVQYNNGGVFGGISGATTNGTILSLTNALLGGATLTTSSVNGVTLTTAGSATTFLNGAGTYTTASTFGYPFPGNATTTALTLPLANATGLPLTTGITGILPLANGGTATSSGGVTNGVEYFNGTNLTNNGNFTYNGSQLLIEGSAGTTLAQFRQVSDSGIAIGTDNLAINPVIIGTLNNSYFSANQNPNTSLITTNTMLFGFGRTTNASTFGNDTYAPSTAVNTQAAEFQTIFNPTASSPNYAALDVNPTISGTSSGIATALAVASKTNTLTGGTVNLLDVGTTTSDYFSGFSSVFKISALGVAKLASDATLQLSGIALPAGSFLATDPNGNVIATTTPSSGSGTVTSVATTYPVTGGPFTTSGTIGLAFGTTTTNIWSNLQTFTGGFLSLASSTINASSTVTGALTLTGATTTASGGGFNVTNGCFAFNGVCLTAGAIGGGSTEAVNWATIAVLAGTPTYSNGTLGVGATLTEIGTGALSVDSNSPAAGDRVLVKNQASAFQNGIYTVTATGSGIASYILTRATDYNSPTEITPGINTYVLSGTVNSDSTWAVSYTPPLTIGTTNLSYSESAASGTVTSVATNSTLTGGPCTTTCTLGINLTNPNVWTGLQQFNGFASSTVFSANQAFFGATATSTFTTAGLLGIASSTPWGLLSVNPTGIGSAPAFAIGSSTQTLFQVGNMGEITGIDVANNFTGRITPTHRLSLQTGTTTAWTASTTGTAYSPFLVAPFSGTVKQIYCLTDASFLGVNIQVNGSNATPSYFVASTTAGNVALTAGNTFTKGQKILMNAGTTTTATTQELSCTLDMTETP